MVLWLALLVIALAVFAAAAVVVALRRPAEDQPAVPAAEDLDADARRTRQAVLESRGDELLARRAELDARRGTLQGNAGIDAEFERLLRRLEAGEIDENEFEAEKLRLLGGS